MQSEAAKRATSGMTQDGCVEIDARQRGVTARRAPMYLNGLFKSLSFLMQLSIV